MRCTGVHYESSTFYPVQLVGAATRVRTRACALASNTFFQITPTACAKQMKLCDVFQKRKK